MPGRSEQINPRGIRILFEEKGHKYTSVINGREKTYISGTSFVSKFFPQFDPTGSIAKKCAAREGISVYEIKSRWNAKRDASSNYGTKIHETAEDALLGNPLRNKPSNEKERIVMTSALRTAKYLKDKSDIIGVEKIIADEILGIAGTIDLLVREKKNGQLWILDHKTNEKSIDPSNKWKSFGLYPIQDIPNTDYWHYTLQLNLYEYLMKTAGYIKPDEIVKKALIHYTPEKTSSIPLPDAQDTIKKMIEAYKNGEVFF